MAAAATAAGTATGYTQTQRYELGDSSYKIDHRPSSILTFGLCNNSLLTALHLKLRG